MEISAGIAQEIVIQMKKVLYQEINFMNSRAIIIASTDKERIGNYHEGAHIVLQNKEPLIIREENEYTGSKKGINMPITLEGDVIGVVGITGIPEEVEKYGAIIKKMTQILIKEDFLKEVNIKRRERFQYIIWNILNFDSLEGSDDSPFVLNYDYHLPHRPIIGRCCNVTSFHNEEVYRIIEDTIRDLSSYMYYAVDQRLFLFTKEIKKSTLNYELKRLSVKLKEKCNHSFRFGAGPVCNSLSEASQGFKYASEALDWNIERAQKEILYFGEMDIGLLITGLKEERKKMFQARILKRIPPEEFQELRKILFSYGNLNKSISKCSEKLFIHKNTLQYKLNKIYKYTGYDPKNINDYVVLYMAFLLSTDA